MMLPELKRLDPFSYWVAPGEHYGADDIVIGTTGVFAILVCDEEGYVNGNAGRLTVGGKRVAGIGALRRGAKSLSRALAKDGLETVVEPAVVFTRATLGRPFRYRGLWVARPRDIGNVITLRASTLQRIPAKRAAKAMGARIIVRTDDPARRE